MVNLNVFWSDRNLIMTKLLGEELGNLIVGFNDQASHYIDLLDWLIGPIDKFKQ